MPPFDPIALGTPIPDRPHAVSCSLPTMAAVRGYEEKDPAVIAALRAGYPRFVVHPFARRLAAVVAVRAGWAGRSVWLVSSARMAADLAAHLGAAEAFTRDGVSGVHHAADPGLWGRAKVFLQNIGGFLSSREAEDALAALGEIPAAAPEALFPGDALAEVRRVLAGAFPSVAPSGLLLAPSGMNAVYAAFCAIDALQRPRGRTVWVQLGWLYLDTIAILRRRAVECVHLPDVRDLGALEALLAREGGRIAGVMTEVPTNPLIQTTDAAALADLCRRHGVRLVLDPSVASCLSVDCLAHADIVTASLTKYTGADGDVIAGLAVVNPAGPDAAALSSTLPGWLEPVYARDLSRLAEQAGRAPAVLRRVESTAAEVAAFLGAHPAVGEVHWALSAPTRERFLALARTPGSTGGMISFTVRMPLDRFYDSLRLPKGPSFGMTTTLICPFMYLAHYDLVTTPEGQAELAASGLSPDLLRLCVGTEPAADIIAALAEALA